MSRICLPKQDTPEGRATRARELAAQRAAYDWVHVGGLPPFCAGVPDGEAFSASKRRRFDWDLRGSVLNAVAGTLVAVLSEPKVVADYDRYYVLRPRPSEWKRWKEDREFARQRVDGVNPFLIHRVDRIPRKLALTEAVAAPVLARHGATLRGLLDAGRVYVVDYEALADCPVAFGRFLEPAIAAFFVDDTGTLMPLAIQLGQDIAKAKVVFTPADDPWQWLLARAFVQSADAAYHEVVSHLVRTHLVMETCWVAASRTLPPTHPVHELLRPHFTDTIAINAAARGTLIAPGGPIDKSISVGSEGAYWLLEKAWKAWSFTDTDPLADFARRDVLDLPGYHFRDDTQRMHPVVRAYVEELLGVFYRSDADVKGDAELAAWVRELGAKDGGRMPGLPGGGRIETLPDLVTLVTGIVWTVSCEHSAVNNGQYDLFGYVPSCPGALFTPAPREKLPMNEEAFTYALPPALAVDDQIALVHLLSLRTEHPLGTYEGTFFQGVPEAQAAVDRLRARLDLAAIAIRARNRTLDVPYTYLDPAIVGRSVAI